MELRTWCTHTWQQGGHRRVQRRLGEGVDARSSCRSAFMDHRAKAYGGCRRGTLRSRAAGF